MAKTPTPKIPKDLPKPVMHPIRPTGAIRDKAEAAQKKGALDKALANSMLDSALKYKGKPTSDITGRDALQLATHKRGGKMRKMVN